MHLHTYNNSRIDIGPLVGLLPRLQFQARSQVFSDLAHRALSVISSRARRKLGLRLSLLLMPRLASPSMATLHLVYVS